MLRKIFQLESKLVKPFNYINPQSSFSFLVYKNRQQKSSLSTINKNYSFCQQNNGFLKENQISEMIQNINNSKNVLEKVQLEQQLIIYLENSQKQIKNYQHYPLLLAMENQLVQQILLFKLYDHNQTNVDEKILNKIFNREILELSEINQTSYKITQQDLIIRKSLQYILKIYFCNQTTPIEILNQAINDYQIITNNLLDQTNEIQIKVDIMKQNVLFYLFVSKLFIERKEYKSSQSLIQSNLKEFDQFIQFRQKRQVNDYILDQLVLKALDLEIHFSNFLIKTALIEHQLKSVIIEFNQQLLNLIYKLFTGKISNYFISVSYNFALYLRSQGMNEKYKEILDPIFNIRKEIKDQNFVFRFLTMYYFSILQNNVTQNQQTILDTISKELDQITDLKIEETFPDIIDYHCHKFIQQKDSSFDKQEFRFKLILQCIPYVYQSLNGSNAQLYSKYFLIMTNSLYAVVQDNIGLQQNDKLKLQLLQTLKQLKSNNFKTYIVQFQYEFLLAYLIFDIENISLKERIAQTNNFFTKNINYEKINDSFIQHLYFYIERLLQEKGCEHEADHWIQEGIKIIMSKIDQKLQSQWIEKFETLNITLKQKISVNSV